MGDIYNYLDSNKVLYRRYDHKAVFTVEESKIYSPNMNGASTKNLFLRDKNGSRHFLITLPEDKNGILIGPVTIATGIGITIESGSTLLIA